MNGLSRRLLLLTGFERSRACGFTVAVAVAVMTCRRRRRRRLETHGCRGQTKIPQIRHSKRPTSESQVGLRTVAWRCVRLWEGRREGSWLILYGTTAWIQYSIQLRATRSMEKGSARYGAGRAVP